MEDSDEEMYTVPYKEPSYLGAGVRKKGIKFVPASSDKVAVEAAPEMPKRSAAEIYLSIVMPGKSPSDLTEPTDKALTICEICKTPYNSNDKLAHVTSMAHKICLPHIHPPSSIDRKRKGLAYLQAKGWDPDSRTGLGAAGEGIFTPFKQRKRRTKQVSDLRPMIRAAQQHLSQNQTRTKFRRR